MEETTGIPREVRLAMLKGLQRGSFTDDESKAICHYLNKDKLMTPQQAKAFLKHLEETY